jgi:hypothetical protein
VLLAGLGAFALVARSFWPFLADDALISLRYAAHLRSGDGLVYNTGEWVEGYSNLLWVLLCSGLGSLGIEPVAGACWLGLLAAGGALATVAWALRRQPLASVATGVGVTALCAPLAIWGQSGMETGLVALLLTLAVVGLAPAIHAGDVRAARAWGPALALAALCLTRPEAPLLVALLAGGWWLAGGQDRVAFRAGLPIILVPAGATLLQVACRRAWYGSWLPNTAHAKLHVPTTLRVEEGVLHVVAFCRAEPVLCLLALLGLAVGARASRGLVRLVSPLLFGTVIWVVAVGGDHFPAWRFLAPLVPVLGLLAGAGVAAIAARRAWLHIACALGLPLLGVWAWQAQEASPYVVLARNQPWVWDQAAVGRVLERAFGAGQPLLATGAAGGVPYWSGLPCLDMLGLTDPWISRQPARAAAMVGHEQGDTAYVLRRRPDLVLFCGPWGGASGCVPQESELASEPSFQRDYALVAVREPMSGRTFSPWARWGSARLGQIWGEEEVVLPAWMLARDEEHAAVPDGQGALVLPLDSWETLTIRGVPLPEGFWSGQTDPPGAGVAVARQEDGTSEVRIQMVDPKVLRAIHLHRVLVE